MDTDYVPPWAMEWGKELCLGLFHGDVASRDVAKSLMQVRETALRSVAKALVPLYKADPVGIAKLCDEQMDQTGNLLGWLRQYAISG